MIESILSLYLYFTTPDWQLRQAMAMSKENAYEKSEEILKTVKPHKVDFNLYCFYRLLNNFRMNNIEEATKFEQKIDENLLPERYRVLTSLMREDMKHWKKDLDDIARDMQHVKDRLVNNDAGKKTKQIQEDIVKRLDKMIEDMEKESESPNSTPQAKQNPADAKPLKDSSIQNDGGTGEVFQARLRKVQERWGSLPPRERAQAIQELTQGMSPRHREAIENYFRNLADKQSKK